MLLALELRLPLQGPLKLQTSETGSLRNAGNTGTTWSSGKGTTGTSGTEYLAAGGSGRKDSEIAGASGMEDSETAGDSGMENTGTAGTEGPKTAGAEGTTISGTAVAVDLILLCIRTVFTEVGLGEVESMKGGSGMATDSGQDEMEISGSGDIENSGPGDMRTVGGGVSARAHTGSSNSRTDETGAKLQPGHPAGVIFKLESCLTMLAGKRCCFTNGMIKHGVQSWR